jgi:hypothetical protein
MPLTEQEQMLLNVPMTVFGVSTLYSVALGWLERRYPIKPDHTWAEVAGGVMITLLPAALAARKTHGGVDWRTYEATVWRCFVASGVPIILWQLGESVSRQVDLLRYAASRDSRSSIDDADHSSPLADRSGERALGSAPGSQGSDPEAAAGADES